MIRVTPHLSSGSSFISLRDRERRRCRDLSAISHRTSWTMDHHVTISFQPTQLKLFSSKKKSLLIVQAVCKNGSKNRIAKGNAALLHIRPSLMDHAVIAHGNIDTTVATSPTVESIAHNLIATSDDIPLLARGTWVNTNTSQTLVIQTPSNIERNRKGTRIVEVTKLLCLQHKYDENYLPTNNDDKVYNEYITLDETNSATSPSSSIPFINLKSERHKVFAHWLIDTYGKDLLSQGSGVLDVAGGNGTISRTLVECGVPSTLLDPNPRCGCGSGPSSSSSEVSFGIIPYALNGNGSDLTSRTDAIGETIRNCSFLCGLHPDQATEPIISLALRLQRPFAVVPCCVMPSLFPNRVQKRYNRDPVRSYSAFCQYLLDMGGEEGGGKEFEVGLLPFVGRNKVIYSRR